jgi:hypothetical protein
MLVEEKRRSWSRSALWSDSKVSGYDVFSEGAESTTILLRLRYSEYCAGPIKSFSGLRRAAL